MDKSEDSERREVGSDAGDEEEEHFVGPSKIPSFRGLRRTEEDIEAKRQARAADNNVRPSEIPSFRGLRRTEEDIEANRQARQENAAVDETQQGVPTKLHRGLAQNCPPSKMVHPSGVESSRSNNNQGSAEVNRMTSQSKLTRGLAQSPPISKTGYSTSEPCPTHAGSAGRQKFTRGLASNEPPPRKLQTSASHHDSEMRTSSSPCSHNVRQDPQGRRLPGPLDCAGAGEDPVLNNGAPETNSNIGTSSFQEDTPLNPPSEPTLDGSDAASASADLEENAANDMHEPEASPETLPDPNDSLVAARPVQEENFMQAEMIDQEAEEVRKEELLRRRRRDLRCFLVLLFVLAVILAVVLSLVPTSEDSVELSPTVAPSLPPSEAPSDAPTLSQETQFRNSLPEYSLVSLADTDSAQAQALGWIVDRSDFDELETWRKEQLFALACFYFSFGGPEWGFPWLDEDPECQWFNGDGSFFLGGSFLSAINVTLNFLSGENISSCYDNKIYGALILKEAFDLSEMSDRLVSLPPELELLSELRAIILSENAINATAESILPLQLRNLQRLRILWVHGTKIRPQYIHGSIPSYIDEFSSLESLHLEWNTISGTLPTELAQVDFRELILRGNCLTGTIPSEFGSMTNLRYLDLRDNDITGTLPTEVFRLTSLRTLGLPFDVVIPDNITELLPPNCSLSLAGRSRCQKDNTQITPGGIFPRYIWNLTNLDELDLSGQSRQGTIPTEIGLLTDLVTLILNDNLITGTVPSELGLCTELIILEMSNCALSGSLPTELGQLSGLEIFHADSNALVGSIPSELGRLVDGLGLLFVQDNDLSGLMPSELGLLPVLGMNLSSNSLSGPIPTEFGQFPYLLYMNLGHNKGINGSLPSELGLLEGHPFLPVFRLDITNTSISGNIPPELAIAAIEGSFKEFNATGTLLSGVLPQEICFLEDEESCFWSEFGDLQQCYLEFDCSEILCGCSCECKAHNTSIPISTTVTSSFNVSELSSIGNQISDIDLDGLDEQSKESMMLNTSGSASGTFNEDI